MKLIFLTIFVTFSLFSATLKSHYTLLDLDLNASLIDPTIEDDFIIYTFEQNKHRKSISSQKLMEIFESHNHTLIDESRGIVLFERKSDIDLEPIKNEIKTYYLSHYPTMKITSITLQSNRYIAALPKQYKLIFRPKAYLYNQSNVQLVSVKSKERFFINYTVNASSKVFKASHNINRGKILTYIDLKLSDEPFERFTGIPLQQLNKNNVRLKKRLVKDKIIYEHDVEPLPLVQKDKEVFVRIHDGNVHLEFLAKSLQDGAMGEVISIQKNDRTRLKAKVIGKNLVEIE